MWNKRESIQMINWKERMHSWQNFQDNKVSLELSYQMWFKNDEIGCKKLQY